MDFNLRRPRPRPSSSRTVRRCSPWLGVNGVVVVSFPLAIPLLSCCRFYAWRSTAFGAPSAPRTSTSCAERRCCSSTLCSSACHGRADYNFTMGAIALVMNSSDLAGHPRGDINTQLNEGASSNITIACRVCLLNNQDILERYPGTNKSFTLRIFICFLSGNGGSASKSSAKAIEETL
ncbi:MAG: hypothetical protein V8S24_11640 [Gordonibacter pamelaeae]